MNFLRMFKSKPKASLAPEVPPERVDEMCRGMYDFVLLNSKKAAVVLNEWVPIPPVRVGTTFGGCAFVEGATKAFRIDHDLHLFEFDGCMDFTSVIVLVQGVPCLTLKAKGRCLTVTIVAGQTYFQEVVRPSGMPLHSEEELLKFSLPVQLILRKILGRMWQVHRIENKDAVETMLAYAEKQGVQK